MITEEMVTLLANKLEDMFPEVYEDRLYLKDLHARYLLEWLDEQGMLVKATEEE